METIGYYNKQELSLQAGVGNLPKFKYYNLNFKERNEVENMDNAIQPICAGVLLTKDNRVLSVHKTDKSTGDNSPEKRKTLLYTGGHLDKIDYGKTIGQTFLNGALRELNEELNINTSQIDQILKVFTVYSPTSPKSAKHFGVIHVFLLDNEFTPNFTDGKAEFIDLKKAKHMRSLEPWSKEIIKQI